MSNFDASLIRDKQRAFFNSGKTKEVSFRIHQLKVFKSIITEHEKELINAVYKDFKKPEFEAFAMELGVVHSEIDYAIKKVKKWSKRQKVSTTLVNLPAQSYIYPSPYGVSLIISPWNYPLLLSLTPLIGAIAAGNCAVLKLSELTPHTSEAIEKLFKGYFDQDYIRVVNGGVEETQQLLEQQFDYIFFTGSTRVGKIIMEAAAKHLTPVTLELGGKSPAIVHNDVDIDVAAKRILWGKFSNAGQTCVAPDYLYLHTDIKDAFLEALKKHATRMFGKDPSKSEDYARIINDQHFQRLHGFLNNGTTYMGGEIDVYDHYIAPTILTDVTWDDEVMKEEIFGPILPVLEYSDLAEAIAGIKAQPKPLALYVFTKSNDVEERVIKEVPFGGGMINDTVAYLGNHHLPFGGVGTSGVGSYHGKFSFDTFTHYKGVLKKPFMFDIALRYAPYKGKLKWIKKLF